MGGFVLKLGKRHFYFRYGSTPFNNGTSEIIANNKYSTNKILEAAGFPVPKADALHESTFKKIDLAHYINEFNFPLVVKPMADTALGTDVLCKISTVSQLETCMIKLYEKYNFISIEEFQADLKSYRILVFYNKVIGIVERFSARVLGDGKHTINELIILQNIEREKVKAIASLKPIVIDEECLFRLNELNMTLDTIPKDNETVVLCYTCNAGRGGTVKGLGRKICKENARLVCQAAKVLDLNFVGFDIMCTDISIPIASSRGVIIEANHNPDITIHEHPTNGMPQQVSKTIMARFIWSYPIAYLKGLYQYLTPSVYVKGALICWLLRTLIQ